MEDEWEQLASRFRNAAKRLGVVEEEEHRARRMEDGREARRALLEDLEGFAKVLEVVQGSREGDVLQWKHGDRTIRFAPAGLGDRIELEWRELTPRKGRIFRVPELADRWVLAVEGPVRDRERLPLFEQGITHLLVKGLRLPPPGEEDAAPAPPASTEATEATEDEGAPSPPSGPRRSL